MQEASERSVRCSSHPKPFTTVRDATIMTLIHLIARAGLDRCIAAHEASERSKKQNLFAIVQGGFAEPKMVYI